MSIAEIRATFDGELAQVASADQLAELRARYIGRNGTVTNLRKQTDFSKLSIEEKRSFGSDFNSLKEHVENALTQAQARFADRAVTPDFDLTLPGTGRNAGAIHPILSTQLEVEDIFRSMGFQVFLGDEAVSEFD